MQKSLLFLLCYFLTPIMPVVVFFAVTPESFHMMTQYVSRTMGLASFTWLSFELLLSARLKFIEKHVGMDIISRLHNGMAPVSLILAIVHAEMLAREFTYQRVQIAMGIVSVLVFGFLIILAIIYLWGKKASPR
jgi:predicted ferric reductase